MANLIVLPGVRSAAINEIYLAKHTLDAADAHLPWRMSSALYAEVYLQLGPRVDNSELRRKAYFEKYRPIALINCVIIY